MRKSVWIVLAALMLCGCSGPGTYETMTDLYYTPQLPEPAEIQLWLPEDAARERLESESTGILWLCDGYTVSMQTLSAGDMDTTLRTVTGYGADAIQGITRRQREASRYECAWASAGEGGDQVGRAVILDDGVYHYAVTVMCAAEQAGGLTQTWQQIMDSVQLDAVP